MTKRTYNFKEPVRAKFKGENLISSYPFVAEKWHPTKNKELTPYLVGPKSERRVSWYCSEHKQEWELEIHKMTANPLRGCLYCLYKENNLQFTDPDVAKEWHPTKNGNLTPQQISKGSNKPVFWLCEENSHEWERSPYQRFGGGRVRGCPYCNPRNSNTLLFAKSLAGAFPEIAKLWHSQKNGTLTPNLILPGSNKNAWWQSTTCGHEWENRISHQVKATECPYCYGKRLLRNINSLQQTHAAVASEWHPTKNGDKTPDDFTSGSDFKPWWMCANNHEWKTRITHRAAGTNCPSCFTSRSSYETEIEEFLEQEKIKFITSDRKLIKPFELDFFIPHSNTAIEFNGVYWHSEAQGKHNKYHYDKWLACKNQGIDLIQIWEDDWKSKTDIVKRNLLEKINDTKLLTDKLSVSSISFLKAKKFLEDNHMSGHSKGTYYLGLIDGSSLKAVMVLTVKNDKLTIMKYASLNNSNKHFELLLDYIKNILLTGHTSIKEIIIVDNHENSNAIFLEGLGFTKNKMYHPTYSYVQHGVRYHKLKFQKSRFENDPKLKYKTGMTEKELASLNKIDRVWNSGSTEYLLIPTKLHD